MRVQILLLILAASALAQPFEDQVNYLPGAPDFNFEIYSGYLNITNTTDPKTTHKKTHYVLVESANDDSDDSPVLIWLNGGPGCSSLLGMFMENGPWIVDDGETQFKLNPHSWNQRMNVLYLEGPVGVGYSWAFDWKSKKFNDVITSSDFFSSLQAFYKKFPYLADNPLWISGESYGGIYVPYLAWRIHEFNTNAEITKETKIPFKGILVGNPATHWEYDTYNSYWPMAYMHNLMDTDTYLTLAEDGCKKYFRDVKPANLTQACILALDDFEENTARINWYDIYRDVYDGPVRSRVGKTVNEDGETIFYKRGFTQQEYTPWLPKAKGDPIVLGDSLSDYLNDYEVRRELHVSQRTTGIESWLACEHDYNWKYYLQPEGSYWIYPLLKAGGYKVLVYSGDTDGAVPTYGTTRWIQDLNWSVKKDWAPWYVHNGNEEDPEELLQVQGYTIEYDGLTFTTVHGVGHMAPQWK